MGTVKITTSLADDGTLVHSGSVSVNVEEGGWQEFELPNNTIAQAIPFDLVTGIAHIDVLLLESDRTISWQVDSSDTAIPLLANRAMVFSGTQIDNLLLSNASGSTANIRIYVGGSAAEVTVGSPATGATGPSGASRLGMFVVTDAPYNAKKDGVTDDTSAIKAAITACQTAGGGIVFFPPGRYYYRATATDTIQITEDTVFLGYGATIFSLYTDYAAGSDWYQWYLTGQRISSFTTLTVNAAIGDTVITVGSTTGIDEGYGIFLGSTTQLYDPSGGSYLKCYFGIVAEVISATSLRLTDPIPVAITTANTLIHIYPDPPKVEIRGLTFGWDGTIPAAFLQSNPANVGATALPNEQLDTVWLRELFNPVVEDVTFYDVCGYGQKYDIIYKGRFSNIKGRNPAGISAYGYGIGVYTNFGSVYENCNVWTSRHGVVMSGNPSFDVIFRNCHFYSQGWDDGRSWDSHIAGRVFVDGCVMPNGIKYAGGEHYFRGCYIGDKNTPYAIHNRGTITFQNVVVVEDCILESFVDSAYADKYLHVFDAGVQTFGVTHWRRNVIINNRAATNIWFGGSWHCDSMTEIRLEDNRLIPVGGAFGIAIFQYATQYHNPATKGLLTYLRNTIPNTNIDTPTLSGGQVPWNTSQIDTDALARYVGTNVLGFYGSTPAVQQVLATGAGKTVDNVITVLQNLGLVRQS